MIRCTDFEDDTGARSQRRGETHGRAKVSDATVVEIRRQVALGVRQVRLAEQYGLSQAQVSRIVSGKQRRWRGSGGLTGGEGVCVGDAPAREAAT